MATDQLIKFSIIKNIYNSEVTLVNGVLNLTYVENTGGAFGIGNDSTAIFVIVIIIVIILITKILISKTNEISPAILAGLGLVLSGGIGNLIDRIFRGFVIDYIDISPLIKYPVFNIADICVVLGIIIVGMNVIVDNIKDRNKLKYNKIELQGEMNERIQNKRRTTK